MSVQSILTLGDLKKSGWLSRSVKQEMRDNLITHLQQGHTIFSEIKGFEKTVIPQLQTAILSRHNFILLGLRGQAKTRIARLCVQLLDEWMPIVKDSEILDDPFHPLSKYAKDLIEAHGDKTPIEWVHRDQRFTEKLATPDVSVADLIGDVDPIKAANQKLTYADERVLHFGLVPRSNRCIFVINELPDLQPRIQVALFNILQEGDIQIRGFKLRLPIDVQFIFTANPEDYTNRGSIVTPLKDRIGSQILTHYPKTIELGKSITTQEANITKAQRDSIQVPDMLLTLIEQIAFEARESDLIDKKSGVSARLTISALENLYSSAERRLLVNKDTTTSARISDLFNIIQSITGKVELVYEGELEGVANVANTLIGKAIRQQMAKDFPDPVRSKKSKKGNPYQTILDWFAEGNMLDLQSDFSNKQYSDALMAVTGLKDMAKSLAPKADETLLLLTMEFILFGLVEFSQISRHNTENGLQLKDTMNGMFNVLRDSDEEGGYYEEGGTN
ncbi:MAG: AAA family ATPase [Bacteroidota bacterium]